MSMNQWSQFEEFVAKRMVEENIVGAAVGVARHGEVIYQKGFGLRDQERELSVTPDTIFGIASVTKSFTAAAIMKLEEESKLSVHDPVINYLPQFSLQGVENIDEIKIHHLLSHTTGLPPMNRRESLNNLEDHINYLSSSNVELLGKPGEYYSYCNDSFLLLGAIIERLTGSSYQHYIKNSILEPLKMERSTFSLDELDKLENVSVPYIYSHKENAIKVVPWPKLGNYAVGGGIRSSVVDLLKYGQLYLDDSLNIIGKNQLQKMWQLVYQTGRNNYYGYALQITPEYANKYTIVEHGGGQPGVSSNFGLIPEEGLVVAVLTNVTGVGAKDIWLAAVNTVLGLPLEQKRSEEPLYEATSEQLNRLTGFYSSAESGHFRVYLEGEQPMVEIDGQDFTLRASDPQTLIIEKLDRPLQFYFHENKVKPWALFNGSRVLRRINELNERGV